LALDASGLGLGIDAERLTQMSQQDANLAALSADSDRFIAIEIDFLLFDDNEI